MNMTLEAPKSMLQVGSQAAVVSRVATRRPIYHDRFVLVDGLNLVRLDGKLNPQFTIVLSIVLELAAHASDFICIFDANTWYVLGGQHRTAEASAYAELVQEFGEFFVECTGGTRADDLILPEAADRNALVVGRDRYLDYVELHPWLKHPNRLLLVNRVRERLYVGSEQCGHRRDLNGLMTELTKQLTARRHMRRN